jgi:hypothetical protein
MEKLDWWGYVHIDGGLHVKRYFDRYDLIEAYESPFVKWITGPFKAFDRQEALEILEKEYEASILKNG